MQRSGCVLWGIGLAVLLGLPRTSPAPEYTPDEMNVVLGFRVEISGGAGSEPDTAWETASGGSLNIAYADATTEDRSTQSTTGAKTIGELTLRGPVSSGRSGLGQWIGAVISGGKEMKRTLAITELTKDGSDGNTWSYLDAFPVRYAFPELSASGTGNLYESVVIQAGGLQSSAGVATRGMSESSHQILENGAGKFRVEIDGLDAASSNVESVSIEDLVIQKAPQPVEGRGGYQQYFPAMAEYGDLTLRVRSGSGELYQWFNDAARGTNPRKNISVMLLKRDGSTARRFNFYDCLPTSYDPGEYGPESNLSVESLTVRVGRVEFATE